MSRVRVPRACPGKIKNEMSRYHPAPPGTAAPGHGQEFFLASFHRHRWAAWHHRPVTLARPATPARLPATSGHRHGATDHHAAPCHTEAQGEASMLPGHHPTSHHAQGQPRATAVERRGMPRAKGRGVPLRDRIHARRLRARRLPIFACFFPFEKSCSLRQATAHCLVKC